MVCPNHNKQNKTTKQWNYHNMTENPDEVWWSIEWTAAPNSPALIPPEHKTNRNCVQTRQDMTRLIILTWGIHGETYFIWCGRRWRTKQSSAPEYFAPIAPALSMWAAMWCDPILYDSLNWQTYSFFPGLWSWPNRPNPKFHSARFYKVISSYS